MAHLTSYELGSNIKVTISRFDHRKNRWENYTSTNFHPCQDWKQKIERHTNTDVSFYEYEKNYSNESTEMPALDIFNGEEHYYIERTNRYLYEQELEKEVEDAIKRVNQKWQKKFEKDIEYFYADEFIKFATKKKPYEERL